MSGKGALVFHLKEEQEFTGGPRNGWVKIGIGCRREGRKQEVKERRERQRKDQREEGSVGERGGSREKGKRKSRFDRMMECLNVQ